MTDTDLRDRIDAVLADAADAIEADDDETLDAVAAAASGIVEDNDSASLLAAVGLADEDDEDASIPEALAEGDSRRVFELERLLKLSRFADREEDEDADGHRADLLDLFEDDENESETGDGEADPDGAEDEAPGDEESVAESVQSAAETVADAVVDSDDESESDGIDVSVPDVGPLDDGEDGSDDSGDEDSGLVETELRDRLQGGLSSFREGIERARGDLESFAESSTEDEGAEEPRPGSGGGRSGRLSTVPGRKRASLRHSTVTGRSHHSTVPDRDDD